MVKWKVVHPSDAPDTKPTIHAICEGTINWKFKKPLIDKIVNLESIAKTSEIVFLKYK